MVKKLDILILKSFVGPFIATFFITLMVLIMQFFWLWVDDFVGKGISTGILLEFIWYQSAVLVPLALPLAVLLSSIMTFGNLGETYEIVAIKSAGISLLRFMRPLLIVTIFISGISFLFSNYIIPVAWLKSRTLLWDIVNARPSFDLKEGVFYDKIPNFSIKIGKKVNDSVIKDVIIYEQSNAYQDNFITASDGVMRANENRRYLEFVLRNGWRYEERGNNTAGTDYVRLGFKEYKRLFDISSLGLTRRTSDTVNQNNARMLSMRQLNVAIDSINRINNSVGRRVHNTVLSQFLFVQYLDSNWTPATAKEKSFDELIPDSLKVNLRQRLSSKLTSVRAGTDVAITDDAAQHKNLRSHQIEWQRKFSMSFACLVLFMIGAPLGSIIRKGGLGSPLVFAIGFFMIFFFSSTSGEKFAKEGSWSVFSGMWLASFILLPIGFFLTYSAMKDSQMFNKEYYYRLTRRLRKSLPLRRKIA